MALDYVLIPVSTLKLTEPSHFDIYVRVSDRYVKVLKEGDLPDLDRINRYLEKKDDVLYIESRKIEYFMDEKFAGMYDVAANSTDAHTKISAFVRCMELGYLDLKLVRLHSDKFMRFALLSELGYDFFKDQALRKETLKHIYRTVNPFSRRALLGGALGGALFFTHVNCSQRAFQSLFLGSILRDISVELIDDKDPHSLDLEDMTEAQVEEFKSHPFKSIRMLKELNLTDDLLETVILQHHEMPRGDGFPKGLKRIETYKPAQYLSLGDWFTTSLEKLGEEPMQGDPSFLLLKVNEQLPEEQRNHLPLLNRLLAQILPGATGFRS